MKKKIKKFSVLQTSKVLAIVYGVIAIIFVPFFLISSFGKEGNGSIVIFSLAVPFLYAIFGFLFTAIFCWTYNIVVKYAGGIEFTLEDVAS